MGLVLGLGLGLGYLLPSASVRSSSPRQIGWKVTRLRRPGGTVAATVQSSVWMWQDPAAATALSNPHWWLLPIDTAVHGASTGPPHTRFSSSPSPKLCSSDAGHCTTGPRASKREIAESESSVAAGPCHCRRIAVRSLESPPKAAANAEALASAAMGGRRWRASSRSARDTVDVLATASMALAAKGCAIGCVPRADLANFVKFAENPQWCPLRVGTVTDVACQEF